MCRRRRALVRRRVLPKRHLARYFSRRIVCSTYPGIPVDEQFIIVLLRRLQEFIPLRLHTVGFHTVDGFDGQCQMNNYYFHPMDTSRFRPNRGKLINFVTHTNI